MRIDLGRIRRWIPGTNEHRLLIAVVALLVVLAALQPSAAVHMEDLRWQLVLERLAASGSLYAVYRAECPRKRFAALYA